MDIMRTFSKSRRTKLLKRLCLHAIWNSCFPGTETSHIANVSSLSLETKNKITNIHGKKYGHNLKNFLSISLYQSILNTSIDFRNTTIDA